MAAIKQMCYWHADSHC